MSMGMSQSLSLNQTTRMLPLQQLRRIQMMKVLRLQQDELREYLEQEYEENPCLELSEKTLHPEDVPEKKEDRRDEETERFERLDSMRDDISYYDEEYSRPSRSAQEEQSERHQDMMENIPTNPKSLPEFLHEQLPLLSLTPETAEAADRIIFNLDASGFLPMPLEEIFGTDPDALSLGRTALSVVQSLEPTGVGARDLKECLLIQILARKNNPEFDDDFSDESDGNTDGNSSENSEEISKESGKNPAKRPDYDGMYTLISRYSKELESNSLPKIAKLSGMSVEHIYTLLRQLSRLNPNPGRDFAPRSSAVTPDLYCTQNPDGSYRVTLEESGIPDFHISGRWQKYCKTDAEREFIHRKHNAAKWLLEAVQMRRETLLKIGNALVNAQPEFLEKGPSALRPLTEKQVAEEIGKHPTTVSRAIAGKWMQTPRGLVALSDFFSASVIPSQSRAYFEAAAPSDSENSENTGNAEDISRDAVQHQLLEIIQNEDKTQPFSDEQLAKMLNIARTTINKYRKELKIPSSRERKVYQ